ncbi:MAG: DUF3426 domain-containing protein [Methyloceanibacter sp.]
MPEFAGIPPTQPTQAPRPPEPSHADWSSPASQVDAEFEIDESLATQVAEINAEVAAPPPPAKRGGIFSRLTGRRAADPVITKTEPAHTDAALAEAAAAEAELAEAALADAPFDADLVAEAMGEKAPPRPPGKKFSASPVTIGWGVLLLVVALVAGMFLFARDTVVAILPGASDIYGTPAGTQGLAFEDVRYDWTNAGGETVLEVQGNVRNTSSEALTVPTVVIALRDDKGEEISEWTTEVGETELAAGEEVAFQRQIPSPPSNVRSLKVRFAKAE